MKKEEEKYLNTREAAEIAGITTMGIIIWCYRYGIGRKRVGRWVIDKKKLEQLLAGELKIEK